MDNNPAYKNSKLPIEARVNDLLSRMTLEEKAGQLCQLDGRNGAPVLIKEKNIGSFLHILGEDINELQKTALNSRLGIPLLIGIDAIHGNAFFQGATIFPTQMALSSSWNPELIKKMARATAKEVIATGAHWTFSPVICIARDLRWGRIDETFGEDPLLIGEMAKAMIAGYQGDDLSAQDSILACAKHYAGYSETQGGRDASEADISRRKLLSYFLPPFEEAARAGCATFMTAYQAIDGIPCTTSSWLLTELLRDIWGFKGFVVTDWNDVGRMVTEQFVYDNYEDASIEALKAGNDMMMVTALFYDSIIEAVKKDKIPVSYLDLACRRILTLKFQLGLFDGKKLFVDNNKIKTALYTKEHQEIALEAAYQSIVLLKNQDNILPLKPGIKSIAVIGPNADDVKNQLGDWSSHSYQINKYQTESHPVEIIITTLKGIQNRVDKSCIINYAKGCEILTSASDNINEAIEAASKSDLVILVLGDSTEITGEKRDRANLDLTGSQMELFNAVWAAGKPVIVVLINSKPLSIPVIAEKAHAILEAWNPGMEGGNAIAGILFGDKNPEGKLSISFPYHVGQQPVYYNQLPGWHADRYVDMPKEPLYSFGFGLSYTSFSYSGLSLDKNILKTGETLTASIDITNTGNREGVEIVQLYIKDCYSSVTTPIKSLKAFTRVNLKPGETKTIKLQVPFKSLSLVNTKLERVVEPGEFEIQTGGSSRDMDLLRTVFYVE